MPRNELPPRENAEIYSRAKQAEQDMEIAGDDRGGKVFVEQDQHGSTPEVVGWKSPTAPWYKEITTGKGKMSKGRVQVALRKIIADKGLDTGKEVEKLKRVLMDGEFTNAEWLPQSDREWAETVRTVEAEQRGEEYTPDLDAQQAATSPENELPEPTQAQKDAGNYRKGHVSIAGLNISVENPEGSERSGVDPQGKEWKVTMKSHYGYIRGTEGADQEQVDVFVKPGTPNDYEGPVFVINQEDQDTQKFDEHKALLGFNDRDAAVEGYLENYADNWDGAGSIATFPNVEAFQDWLNRGDKRRPVGELESIDEAEAVAERPGTYAPLSKHGAPMYLKAAQVLQDKMPNRAGGEQVLGILANAGVKADELEQTTLYDYLAAKQNGVVTKQEIMKFLEDNHPSARLRLQPIKRSENEQDYSQYTLPGGENYREWAIIYNPPSGGEYFTNHFENMNVLAHARTKDRTGPNGERMLFIEELQSDWHLQGRKQGYDHKANRLAVPDAPFKNTWHEYALKEMLHLASKEGYESIGWTTGEQQNERYQIRNVVDELEYWPRPDVGEDGWYLVARKNGGLVKSKRVKNKQELESFVGKDVANKIVQGQGEQSVYQDKTIRTLRGDDLVIGGRWAENLYDRAMPSFLKKYTKQWGAAPGTDTMALPTPDYEKAVEYVGYQHIMIMGKGGTGDQIVIEAFGENGKSIFFETLAKKDMEKVLGPELAAHIRRREGPVSKNFRSTQFIQQADKLLESADEPGFYRQLRGNFLQGVTGKLQEGFKESRMPEFTEQTIHTLKVTKAMKDDVLEGQALFERQKADPDQMPMQFAVKPPTVWQGREIEQSDMFGEGALPEEQARTPAQDPGIRKVPGGRTIAQELRPRLERKESVDLRGATVKGPEDLGELAQVYRSPHYETLRIFYVKGDKIIAHEGLTSRLANTAVPFKDMGKGLWEMADRMKRLGADGYYLLHNHPSGRPDPSPADVGLTKNIAAHVPGFRAHVIINHESFSSFSMEDLPFHLDHEIKNLDFRKERVLDHPLIGEKVGSPGDLAWYAKQLERTPETATIIFTKRAPGKHSVVTAIQELPWKFVQSKDAAAYIRNSMKAFGAVDVFSVVENPDNTTLSKLRGLYASNLLRDVLVLKGQQIKSVAEEGSPLEDSMRSQRTLGIKYKDVPSLRVREQQQMYEGEGTPPTETKTGPPTKGRQRPLYGDPANPNYEVSEPTPLDGVLRKFQDMYVDIRRFVEDLKAAGKEIADELNPVYKEEVYHQKVALQSRRFLKDELEPLVKKMRVSNVNLENLDAYMLARHVIKDKVNARLRDMNLDRDDNEALSGMTDEEAQAILDRTPETVKRLAPAVDAMLKESRRLRVEYGLDSQEAIDAWEDTYDYYVPLQREGFEHDGPGTGRGQDVRGSDVKTRLGSTRGVLPILSSIAYARNKVIVRGEKMKPVVALAGLLVKYPNAEIASLAKPTPIQYTDPQTGLTEVVAGDTGNYKIPMIRRKNKDGKVESVPDSNYTGRDNVVNFRLHGKPYAIVFSEKNERAMQMARALKGLDTEYLRLGFRVFYPVTRWLASVNTQYNPIFGVINFIRDTSFAMLTLSETALSGKQGDVLKHTLSNMRGIYAEARAQRRGEHSQVPTSQLWRRFEKAGGPTGYRDMFTNQEDRATPIEQMLSPGRFQQMWKGAGGEAVAGWLSDYNLMMENAIRLGVFKTAIDSGMSDLAAASHAKNVTVNFNKKGNKTNQWGALFAFFNASIQGTWRMAETLVKIKGGKFAGWTKNGKKIVQGGILLGGLQTMWLAMAGYDDDDIEDWILSRNLVIPIPGTDKRHVTIPLPLGFNVLPNIGRAVAETVIYGKPVTHMANLFFDLMDVFSPVGGVGSLAQFAAPTALDPAMALIENKDWTGRPVYRENISSLDPTPGHARARETTPAWAVAFSRAINYLSGGTDYQPGALSPNPDAVTYLIGQALGGVARETNKAIRVGESLVTGEDLPPHAIPLVGRLTGSASGSTAVRGRYYDVIEDLHGIRREIKGRARAGESVREVYDSNPLAKLAGYGVRIHGRIKRLKQRRRMLIQRSGHTDAVKAVETQMDYLMKQVVDRAKALKDAA